MGQVQHRWGEKIFRDEEMVAMNSPGIKSQLMVNLYNY
jgi:hypothetical protein